MTATQFETRSCTRCGGSGRYSFNQFDGDRCFGCAGKGRTLTTRGKAASDWLKSLREVPAGEVKVGDVIHHEVLAGLSVARATSRVVEVGASKVGVTTIVGDTRTQSELIEIRVTNSRLGDCRINVGSTKPMRLEFDPATKAEQFARALAYQATLDDRGEPIKAAA